MNDHYSALTETFRRSARIGRITSWTTAIFSAILAVSTIGILFLREQGGWPIYVAALLVATAVTLFSYIAVLSCRVARLNGKTADIHERMSER